MSDNSDNQMPVDRGHREVIPPPRDKQRIEINSHIRVLWGAKVGRGHKSWIGWAVWDDFEEECPVFHTLDQAMAEATRIAQEYANGERG